MRPLIGVCCEFEEWHPRPGFERSYLKLYHQYYHAISRAGGLPVAIPTFEDPQLAIEAMSRCSGVMLTGGDDLRPHHYGESPHPAARATPPWREAQDLFVAKHLLSESRLPVLAICMGSQLLAVAGGGRLIQDVPSAVKGCLEHRRGTMHPIAIEAGSRLARSHGTSIIVNSYHHQAVADTGKFLKVVARSSDGVVEATEGREVDRYLVAVQWHPERSQDEASRALFANFVKACGG